MNKSHRDIKGESISNKDDLRQRMKEISNKSLDPVYVEPKIEPKSFFDRARAKVLDRILPFVQKHVSFEFYLNVNEFVNGESNHLRLELFVYIAGRQVIGREVKLI